MDAYNGFEYVESALALNVRRSVVGPPFESSRGGLVALWRRRRAENAARGTQQSEINKWVKPVASLTARGCCVMRAASSPVMRPNRSRRSAVLMTTPPSDACPTVAHIFPLRNQLFIQAGVCRIPSIGTHNTFVFKFLKSTQNLCVKFESLSFYVSSTFNHTQI